MVLAGAPGFCVAGAPGFVPLKRSTLAPRKVGGGAGYLGLSSYRFRAMARRGGEWIVGKKPALGLFQWLNRAQLSPTGDHPCTSFNFRSVRS